MPGLLRSLWVFSIDDNERRFQVDWNQMVERVTPHIVKIETPQGHATVSHIRSLDDARKEKAAQATVPAQDAQESQLKAGGDAAAN